MDIIKTMGDFKIPQFTLLTSPEQDEIVCQREAEAERERESGGTFISIELGGGRETERKLWREREWER